MWLLTAQLIWWKTLPSNLINNAVTDLLIALTGSDELNIYCCLLGKRLGDGYYVGDGHYGKNETLLKRLNAFYDKHQWEDTDMRKEAEEVSGRWQGLDCFEIVYEMDDDFTEKVTGYF